MAGQAWLDPKLSGQPPHQELVGLAFAGTRGGRRGACSKAVWRKAANKLSARCQKRVISSSGWRLRFVIAKAAFAKSGLDEKIWLLQASDFLNSRRRILPDAVLGTAITKWTSRGCLYGVGGSQRRAHRS